MKLPESSAILCLALFCNAFAGEAREVVLEVQSVRFAAMIDADGAALDAVLANDLVYTHTTGRTETKSEFMASVSSGDISYRAITPRDMHVRVYGDIAVVTGTADMAVSAGDAHFEFSIRFTEVYRTFGDSWQLVSWQSTRMADQ